MSSPLKNGHRSLSPVHCPTPTGLPCPSSHMVMQVTSSLLPASKSSVGAVGRHRIRDLGYSGHKAIVKEGTWWAAGTVKSGGT